jgi:hypothetical protein
MLKKLMSKASDVASLQPRDLPVGLGHKGAVVVEVAGYRNGDGGHDGERGVMDVVVSRGWWLDRWEMFGTWWFGGKAFL